MKGDRIVAVALLNEPTFTMLRSSLKRVYRIDDTPRFDKLIAALDELERDAPAHPVAKPDGTAAKAIAPRSQKP